MNYCSIRKWFAVSIARSGSKDRERPSRESAGAVAA